VSVKLVDRRGKSAGVWTAVPRRTQNLVMQHLSLFGDEQVDRLDHVQKHLVLAVLDGVGSPADRIGDRGRNLGGRRQQWLATLLCDELSQHRRIGRLWIAKVHHFVQQFVNEHEIVATSFLVESLEVFAEHLRQTVEEGEDHGSVGIASARGRHQIQVVVLDPTEVQLFVLEHGRQHEIIVFLHQNRQKLMNFGVFRRIRSIVATDQHFAAQVEKVNGTGRHSDQYLARPTLTRSEPDSLGMRTVMNTGTV
jgi:hypothetical protein